MKKLLVLVIAMLMTVSLFAQEEQAASADSKFLVNATMPLFSMSSMKDDVDGAKAKTTMGFGLNTSKADIMLGYKVIPNLHLVFNLNFEMMTNETEDAEKVDSSSMDLGVAIGARYDIMPNLYAGAMFGFSMLSGELQEEDAGSTTYMKPAVFFGYDVPLAANVKVGVQGKFVYTMQTYEPAEGDSLDTTGWNAGLAASLTFLF